jgi:hypothetical protein
MKSFRIYPGYVFDMESSKEMIIQRHNVELAMVLIIQH